MPGIEDSYSFSDDFLNFISQASARDPLGDQQETYGEAEEVDPNEKEDDGDDDDLQKQYDDLKAENERLQSQISDYSMADNDLIQNDDLLYSTYNSQGNSSILSMVMNDEYSQYDNSTSDNSKLDFNLKSPAVNVKNVNPKLSSYLNGLPDDLKSKILITSANDQDHAENSLHYENKALDLRYYPEIQDYIKNDPIAQRMGISVLNPNHGTAKHTHIQVKKYGGQVMKDGGKAKKVTPQDFEKYNKSTSTSDIFNNYNIPTPSKANTEEAVKANEELLKRQREKKYIGRPTGTLTQEQRDAKTKQLAQEQGLKYNEANGSTSTQFVPYSKTEETLVRGGDLASHIVEAAIAVDGFNALSSLTENVIKGIVKNKAEQAIAKGSLKEIINPVAKTEDIVYPSSKLKEKVDPETGNSIFGDFDFSETPQYGKLLNTDKEYTDWADLIHPKLIDNVSPKELKQLHQEAINYFGNTPLEGSGAKQMGMYIRSKVSNRIKDFTEPIVRDTDGELLFYKKNGFLKRPKLESEALATSNYDVSKLTPQDWNIIDAYTHGYDSPINSVLRTDSKEGISNQFYRQIGDHLNETILKNKFSNPTTLYRGISNDYMVDLHDPVSLQALNKQKLRSELQVGDAFKDNSFISSSFNPDLHFGTHALSEVIDVPGGNVQSYAYPNASTYTQYFNEREAILPRGLIKKVEEITQPFDYVSDMPLYEKHRFRTSILNPYLVAGAIGTGAAIQNKKYGGKYKV